MVLGTDGVVVTRRKILSELFIAYVVLPSCHYYLQLNLHSWVKLVLTSEVAISIASFPMEMVGLVCSLSVSSWSNSSSLFGDGTGWSILSSPSSWCSAVHVNLIFFPKGQHQMD